MNKYKTLLKFIDINNNKTSELKDFVKNNNKVLSNILDNKIIEEFQIIDFKVERTKEMDELEEYYNNGVVTDEHAQELISAFVEKNPTQFANDIEEAFGNQQERRKIVHEMDFEDLI